ncbi:hypothetical protein EOA13_15690 [Mesorhizobium sp. M7A.F.Ca.US.011.01.1.1]|uniref:hypothetical protein n=1 Tax=unclassified Mesorhizobium TaxID=325217 RepID=UPI000FCAD6DA|nr:MULTISPECIES: hypothetical protein [unclassified Mesorhizobium]RUW89864.1 hypothetical protein EOA19_22800 [Mesorhizobium sp. M7A.F.Ca.US.010.02.1.1]RUX28842.1 hypothetical protein EOA13_15690 [Mesorhizobium sp. M7A.F.Ca.US.011.01.1.1]
MFTWNEFQHWVRQVSPARPTSNMQRLRLRRFRAWLTPKPCPTDTDDDGMKDIDLVRHRRPLAHKSKLSEIKAQLEDTMTIAAPETAV